MQKHSPYTTDDATYSDRNLHGLVVHELGRRIVGGAYPPGRPLPSEEDLCAQLAVSRTALREAVKVLAAKGLVDSRPRVGTRVRPSDAWNLLDPDVLAWRCATGPDAGFVNQLAELREVIEPHAAALAARHRTDEHLHALEQAYAAMEGAADRPAWIRADRAFHTAILRATGNPFFGSLAALVGATLAAAAELRERGSGDFKATLRDHGKVLDAIRARDEMGALHRIASLVSESRALMNEAVATQDSSAHG